MGLLVVSNAIPSCVPLLRCCSLGTTDATAFVLLRKGEAAPPPPLQGLTKAPARAARTQPFATKAVDRSTRVSSRQQEPSTEESTEGATPLRAAASGDAERIFIRVLSTLSRRVGRGSQLRRAIVEQQQYVVQSSAWV